MEEPQLNAISGHLAELPQRPDHGSGSFLLGIDIGGTKVALGSMALGGPRLLTRRIPTLAEQGAEQVLARVLAEAHELAEQTADACGLALAAVGAVTPGVVREDGILLAPNNPGWDVLPLRARLREAFPGVPVAVMNDVRAAALAEAAEGALRGADPAVFVNLGTGISAAILIGGSVLEGGNGAAGEIAYQQIATAPGPGFADGRAPLEERVSGQAIAARAGEVLGRPVSAAEVFAAAPGQPGLQAVLDAAFDALALQVTNLAVALNPSHVVLSGGLVPNWDGLVPRLRDVLRRAAPFPPQVLTSRLDPDAALVGALTIAARELPPQRIAARSRP